MKKNIIAASLAVLCLACSLPALSEEYTTTLADQQGVSVTIYNQNLALVKDRRTIRLPAGQNVLAFREVSAQIKPETALLSGGNLDILEQNFEFDLLTPQALLEKYVGKEVTVIRTHPTTGEETREKAKVLSANNGVVLQLGDHIETGIPGRLVFDHVPENLRDRPTLTMLADSGTDKSQQVELSYLTSGLGWQADYVAELNPADNAMDINGWVTLTNQSGATYNNASLQLVAGDVNQVSSEKPNRMIYREKAMAMSAEMDAMAEEQMFEYHLYTLERPTTIGDNQTKQVALLQAGQVPCRKELILQGADYYYHSQYGELGQKMKIGVFVEIANSKENHLGLPLPKGVVRVYKKDSRDRLQFVGEDRIDHTPENETLRLKLGDSFDVTANRKQTDFKKVAGFTRYDYVYEGAFRIELKNGKKEAVTVKVVEPIPGDWEMLEESLPHEKAASNTAVWQVPVPSLGSITLTYRVRVKY
ncbi:MAG: DUF4139 domain-containing protein [Proteobacteria bacterium]|nr:DUF4139 domain-containing protein [Pseudomonadota bacterium]MBU0967777.1 DUF4139 domain-containing protein [Pseudomonadota bacterium]